MPSDRNAERDGLLLVFKHGLSSRLRTFAPHASVRSLADVIAFNRAHADIETRWFEQPLFEQAEGLGDLDSPR